MTQGLYNKQALGKARYDVLCGIMKNDPNPVSAHYAGVEAEQLTREMNLRTLKISDNEFIIGNLQSTIETLSNVILASAQRTLALRHLEDAQSRLIRELGDRPDRESPESPIPWMKLSATLDDIKPPTLIYHA